MIRYKRLHWLGHARRMGDCRLPKRLMFGELAEGTRPSGGPRQRWKDAIQGDFRKFGMKFRVGRREEQWSADAEDRLKWKAALERGKDEHTSTEGNRHAAKRVKRKTREATYAPRRTASATRVLLAKDNAVSATVGTAAAPPPPIRRRPPASKLPAAPRRRTIPTPPSAAISSTASRVAIASTSVGVVTRRQSRAAAAATSLGDQPPITTSSAAGPSSSVGAASSTTSRVATSSASGGVVTRRQSRAAAAATSSCVQPPITSSSAAGSSLSVAMAPAARARRSSTAPLPSTRRSNAARRCLLPTPWHLRVSYDRGGGYRRLLKLEILEARWSFTTTFLKVF
jgi:hypothetical protein